MKMSREQHLLGAMRSVELVDSEGRSQCDFCGKAPLIVEGTNLRASDDDNAWEADAITACCRQQRGVLREERDSIFGAREDLGMLLHSRARVY